MSSFCVTGAGSFLLTSSVYFRFSVPPDFSKPPLKAWKDFNFNVDKLSFASENKPLGYTAGALPRQQLRSGKSFGLSVLLDPDLDDYFCTNTDSMGFQVSHLTCMMGNYLTSHVTNRFECYLDIGGFTSYFSPNRRKWDSDSTQCRSLHFCSPYDQCGRCTC